VVSVLSAQDPTRGGDFELSMRSVPGDPDARAQNADYLLPLQQQQFRIDQGYGGHFSHTEPEHRYAIDFAAEIGTPVLAARDGTVMQVETDFDKAGLNLEKFGDRANFVRIVHDDGSMALYAHLKADDGVIVRVGQRVQLSFDALPRQRVQATIRAIAGAPDRKSEWGEGRYFTIDIDLPPRHGLPLLPGMSVRVTAVSAAPAAGAQR
ncbi:peptidoglycan DD-metalloendopeptidase family protein, partial [Lysobacter sp. 2RAB21]